MTVREIEGFLAEMNEVEVSPDLISTVTDSIVAEVTAWQSRPLKARVPRGVLRCAARQGPRRGRGAQQSHLARDPARRHAGHPRALDDQTEGAKFRMKVFADLKARGSLDILIAVTDGLKGRAGPWHRLPGDHAADLSI
jgi:putative transposase